MSSLAFHSTFSVACACRCSSSTRSFSCLLAVVMQRCGWIQVMLDAAATRFICCCSGEEGRMERRWRFSADSFSERIESFSPTVLCYPAPSRLLELCLRLSDVLDTLLCLNVFGFLLPSTTCFPVFELEPVPADGKVTFALPDVPATGSVGTGAFSDDAPRAGGGWCEETDSPSNGFSDLILGIEGMPCRPRKDGVTIRAMCWD